MQDTSCALASLADALVQPRASDGISTILWLQRGADESAGFAANRGCWARSREQCRELVKRTVDRFGGIDVPLHNAAYTEGGRIDTMTDDKLALTFNVGLMPCFWLTADALPHLKRSKAGRVLVTSSILGNQFNRPGRTAYGSMKMGVTGFVKAAAMELACHGITVNAVEPGTTKADSIDRLVPAETLTEMISAIPWGG